ncbi:MAG: hypothetical protein ACFE8U_11640, partial [Candidatus Hermodarchaeota archaeon]
MTKILVVLEISKGKITGITKECITAVRLLNEKLGADLEGVILGQNIADLASEAIKYGIQNVHKVDDSQFAGVNILFHTRTLEALIKQEN